MQKKNNQLDFSKQKIFIGLDLHKKKWVVTIRMNHMELKTYSMEPSVEKLAKYLRKNYPKAKYYSVYEAGFSGYWADRELRRRGIENIIVNPADVPTTNKEKENKDDHKDSRKLARELENHTIKGIYIPPIELEELRSLSRLRSQFVEERARIKNRIKSFLSYYGKEFPGKNTRYWSESLLAKLRAIEFSTSIAEDSMNSYLEHLILLQEKVKTIEQLLRTTAEELNIMRIIKKIESIPGIGFVSAIVIYSELFDIKRFKKLDQLCSYIGLIPSTHSSGEKERINGLTLRQKSYLRNIIIEASWIAVRKDPALTMSYSKFIQRMDSQKAIIKIAKKLLNRIRYVWLNEKEYKLAMVK